MSLPQKLPFALLITAWAKILDPIIAIPILNGIAINGIQLNVGVPKLINTGLGRAAQGWFPIDNLNNATIWRTQPFNAQSITLQASADTTINIWIF